MSVEAVVEFYKKTEIGQELRRQVLEEVLEESIEEGTARTLARMLHVRFGADSRIPAIATRLAHQADQDAAVDAAVQARTLDELA